MVNIFELQLWKMLELISVMIFMIFIFVQQRYYFNLEKLRFAIKEIDKLRFENFLLATRSEQSTLQKRLVLIFTFMDISMKESDLKCLFRQIIKEFCRL